MRTIYKTYKFRIYPNKNQEILLNKTFGCTRFIFNKMLTERKETYEKYKDDKEALKAYKYCTEKKYKEEFEWLKEVDSIALQQARVDLDIAYKNFFDSITGKRKGKKISYPKYKSKKETRQTYRTINVTNNIAIVFENKRIKLPKLKWVKYSDDRIFNGDIKNVTVEKTSTGKYFACILVEENIATKIHQVSSQSKCIGLDMDMKKFYTDNKGVTADYPRFYRKNEKKLAKEQKRLSRKVKGSNNRNKQRIKVARVHEKIVNSRKDFQNKISTTLVKNYDVIGVETLNMQAMSQCLNLGKSVMDNAWGYFVNMLEYKCDWYGKHLVFADKYYASSKMCNVCGYKNVELSLSVREWDCPICGTHHNRDHNAGINLVNFAKEKLSISTEGASGIYASGEEETQVASMKEESLAFRQG